LIIHHPQYKSNRVLGLHKQVGTRLNAAETSQVFIDRPSADDR
jgi:hypothetical protein